MYQDVRVPLSNMIWGEAWRGLRMTASSLFEPDVALLVHLLYFKESQCITNCVFEVLDRAARYFFFAVLLGVLSKLASSLRGFSCEFS